MEISQKGLDLLKQFEGCKLDAYRCPAGVWTIGYGHTRDVEPGQVITRAEAEDLLREDLADFEEAVGDVVEIELTQGQFDALVSFAYNVGKGALRSSTLLRLLNNNDIQGAANQFVRWNKAGGQVLKGLTRRRLAEKELFLS